MLTLPVLLAANLVVWAAALVYVFRLIPGLARRWNPWLALGSALAAAVLSLASYPQAQRLQVREQARKHYFAGIGEKQRGDLAEAEKQFEKAIALQPGD